MNQPLISIIVPVYNVEKYLKKCIDSIIDQSYKNIEIILIDDGSTDNSGVICDEYENSYNNIRVVHKNNAGLGLARNSGLEIIKGEYVTFIDSDDWVAQDLIYELYNSAKKNRVDFCKSGFWRVKHNGEVVSITKYENELFSGEDAAQKLLPRMIGSSPDAHDSLEMCVCGVLYNAKIIREFQIVFPSERVLISEDLVFNVDYMQHANGGCSIEYNGYYYRMNDVSLSHRYREDRLDASAYFYKYMRKKLQGLGYGNDTMLRLDRMFFIFVRMSIQQEKKTISKYDKNTSINNIEKICQNEIVKSVINEYPVARLGIKQKAFIWLIQHKSSNILYMLVNCGIV